MSLTLLSRVMPSRPLRHASGTNTLKHSSLFATRRLQTHRVKLDTRVRGMQSSSDFPRRQLLFSLFSSTTPGDVVLFTYALVLASGTAIFFLAPDELNTGDITDAFSLLGVYFVIAQAIERFLEPLKSYLGIEDLKQEQTLERSRRVGVAIGTIVKYADVLRRDDLLSAVSNLGVGLLDKLVDNLPEPTPSGTEERPRGVELEDKGHAREIVMDAVDAAWKCELNVVRIRQNTSSLFWGFASCCGMWLSWACKVGILHSIGLTDVPITVDIILTGFAVGAGTQPLNKLIEKLEK